ncbi:hypothetical protein FCOIX_10018 [Fusarium coicis]|nr:hypothetical protein FCOIX_10018 [Fusarium coicis]
MPNVVVLRNSEGKVSGLLRITGNLMCNSEEPIELVAISKGSATGRYMRTCLEENILRRSTYGAKGKGLWPVKHKDAQGMPFRAAYDSAGRWVVSDDQQYSRETYVVCAKGDYKKDLELLEYKDDQEYQFYNVLWALIALFMIGGTASWFDVNDTGSEYFPRLKRHVQSLKTSGRMSPTGHSQTFFENTLACWEMFLAFVVDGDETEVFDSPHLPLLPSDQDPEPRSIFPVVQIPHPVTGVAHEIHTTLARVGRLVRRNRRRAMSKQFLTRESILEAHREVDEAVELEILLTNLQVPLESAIVQTGDSQTPTWHLTALAEVYRFAGLIQLYHVFSDTLVSRMNLQNSHPGEVAEVSAHEAEERLRQFTLKAVEILRSIPAGSGTKDFHPFLIVAVCSALTIPVVEVSAYPQDMAGLGNSLALVAADVHRARGFLRGRLQLLLHSLPKNPIRRCIDIVEATWAETDNRPGSSGRPAYWMDVMMQNNWETFMA